MLAGPAVIEEFGSTVPLHPGFTATVDSYANLLITREATASEHRRRPGAEERSERGAEPSNLEATASEHRRRPGAEERSERGAEPSSLEAT